MCFTSWCLCHAFDVKRRLDAIEQALLRRRMLAEQAACRARTIAAAMRDA